MIAFKKKLARNIASPEFLLLYQISCSINNSAISGVMPDYSA